jgi:hypothetical protein
MEVIHIKTNTKSVITIQASKKIQLVNQHLNVIINNHVL